MLRKLILPVLACTLGVAYAQQVQPKFDPTKTRVAVKMDTKPTIDGNFDLEGDGWNRATGASAGGFWNFRYDDALADKVRGASVTTGGQPPESDDDLSAKIYVGFDEKNFYVGVEVKDSVISTDNAAANTKNGETWQDDSVEVFIDGDNSNNAARDTSGTNAAVVKTGGQYVITANNAYREAEAGNPGYGADKAWFAKTAPNADGTGYDAEFVIPLSTIGNPKLGTVIGFTIAINDDDGGGNAERQLIWVGKTHEEATYGNILFGKRSYEAPKVTTAPKIDGKIDATEYTGAPEGNVTPYNGEFEGDTGDDEFKPEDQSFRFWTTHDDAWFYVAVDVTDDKISTDSADPGSEDGSTWQDDSVEIFFDGDLSLNTGRDNNANEGQFVLTANGAWRDNEANNPNFGADKDWFAATTKTAQGYAMEFKVKKSILAAAPLDKDMGFNICINDDDIGGNRKSQLNWSGRPHSEFTYGILRALSKGAAVVATPGTYVESSGGELSEDVAKPTPITLISGSNSISGTMGKDAVAAGKADADVITFTVPAGQQISSINVTKYSVAGGGPRSGSFLAIASGTSINGASAATHLSNTLVNAPGEILTTLSAGKKFVGAFGSASGPSTLSNPVGPGTYTLWFQEQDAKIDYTIALTVGAAVPPPKEVSITLGATNTGTGLSLKEPAEDGTTSVVTKGGSSVRSTTPPAGKNGGMMYFATDANFANNGNVKTLFVTVEYLDEGTDEFSLEYDAVNPDDPNPEVDMFTVANDKQKLAKYDSKRWLTYQFRLTDVYFGKRQPGASDFRINDQLDGPEFIRKIVVSREEPIPLHIKYATTAVKLDGVLDDAVWKDAQIFKVDGAEQDVIRPSKWTGPADYTMIGKFAWDNKYLYIGYDVTDDVPRANTDVPGTSWNGDGAEAYIGFDQSNPGRTSYIPDTDFQITVSAGPNPTYGIFQSGQLKAEPTDKYPAKDIVVVKDRAGGYIMEIRIPWEMLVGGDNGKPSNPPAPGQLVGFNVFANDGDNVDSPAQEKAMGFTGRPQAFRNPSAWATVQMDAPPAATSPTPVAIWKFDGDGKDSSGNGLDGVITGAAFSDDVPTGATGKSLLFKANTDFVQVAHNAKLNVTNAMTISAWVKPIGNVAWDGILAKNPSDGSAANHAGNYELRIENGSRKPTFLYQRGAKDDTATLGSPGAAVVPVGVWSHLAVTATKGGDAIFYLNGAEIGKVAVEGTFGVTNTSPLYIGSRADKFTNMDGLLDNVALYTVALSADEVKKLATLSGGNTGTPGANAEELRKLISQTRYAAGAFGITLQTKAGAKYDLEYSQDLKTWAVINADVAGTGQPLSPNETDAARKARSTGFYRVRVK